MEKAFIIRVKSEKLSGYLGNSEELTTLKTAKRFESREAAIKDAPTDAVGVTEIGIDGDKVEAIAHHDLELPE